jgi:hypothetical protein
MPSLINKIFTDKRLDNIDWLLFNVKWAVFHLFSWWKKGLQTIDHVGKRLVLGWTYGWYFLMFKRKWNWISGVMVNVIAWSGWIVGTHPSRVKSKIMKMTFAVSTQSPWYLGLSAKTGRLGNGIMCQSGATWRELSDWCF